MDQAEFDRKQIRRLARPERYGAYGGFGVVGLALLAMVLHGGPPNFVPILMLVMGYIALERHYVMGPIARELARKRRRLEPRSGEGEPRGDAELATRAG
jgi:hypothetical protein